MNEPRREAAGRGAGNARGATTGEWAWCEQILPHVSRTFALGIRILPPPLRREVTLAYLICRIADTVEDCASLTVEARTGLLAVFRSALTSQDQQVDGLHVVPADEAHRALLLGAEQVFTLFWSLPAPRRAIIGQWATEMAVGMAQVLEANASDRIPHHNSFRDLERYCYFVAGTVGHMLTELFAGHLHLGSAQTIALESRATAFGEGLQLVNIIRDASDDLAEGRIWIPRDLFMEHGVTPSEFFSPAQLAPSWAILRTLQVRATHDLDRAMEYCVLLPRRSIGIRIFCALPVILAGLTLRKVDRARRSLAPSPRVKVGRRTVYAIAIVLCVAAFSNTGLRAVFGALRAPRIGMETE